MPKRTVIPRETEDGTHDVERAFPFVDSKLPKKGDYLNDDDGEGYVVERVEEDRAGDANIYVRGPVDANEFEPTSAKPEGEA